LRNKSGLYFFLLISGIQAAVFCIIDPFAYPDTIRYINFADLLRHPGVAHFGDLAHNNGILFTPLFLPYFLVFFKKLALLPYVLSGSLLQFVSFQAILWLAYAIALRIDGEKTARLALILLLTHLVFCFRSAFILTEYPFTAVLLFIIFYALNDKAISLKRALIFSLLFGLLISIRIQGLLFMVIIASYLLRHNKARLRTLLILCSIPLAYLLFYVYFYLYLNNRLPSTITMNEIFSLNSFFLGDGFAKYNFSAHGPEALVTQKISPYIFHDLTAYVTLISARISDHLKFLSTGLRYYYLFFTALTCLALIFSKVREKSLLIFLILFNFIATILFLAPYYAVLRYQAGIFPLAMILIASCFIHSNEGTARRGRLRRYGSLFALLLYALYFGLCHYDFFQAIMVRGHNHRVMLRKEAVNSARLIASEIGHGQNVTLSDPVQYNIIYRSGNIPVYFFDGWEERAILDYIKIRRICYFIGQHEVIGRLKRKGISSRIICPIIETPDWEDRLFLCEFLPLLNSQEKDTPLRSFAK
jgi:hypothetical protein